MPLLYTNLWDVTSSSPLAFSSFSCSIRKVLVSRAISCDLRPLELRLRASSSWRSSSTYQQQHHNAHIHTCTIRGMNQTMHHKCWPLYCNTQKINNNTQKSNVQGVPEKQHKVWHMISFEPFAIKLSFFASKYLAKINVYQSTQNLCKWAIHSLLSSWK